MTSDPGVLTGDLFHLSGALSKDSVRAITDWYCSRDREDLHAWITIESACLLLMRLKVTRDIPTLFPKGKWATVQALEQKLLEYLLSCEEAAQ